MNNPQTSPTPTSLFKSLTWRDTMTATDNGTHPTLQQAWESIPHLYPVSPRIQVWESDYSEISEIMNGEVIATYYFANPTLDENADAFVEFDLTTPILEQIQHLNPIK